MLVAKMAQFFHQTAGLRPEARFTKYLTIYRLTIVTLKGLKFLFLEYRKLICEHCLGRSYNFASESYERKALRSS